MVKRLSLKDMESWCTFLFSNLYNFIFCHRESINQTETWESEKFESQEPAPKSEDTGIPSGEPTPDSTPVEEKPVEEEAKELTLDEWKALRQTRAKPTFNLRKAGEGEDLSRWKKMYALERKKEDDEEEEEEEYDATEYPQRVGRQKHLLDIDIQFSDSRRSAGGRGGRGGRGRGERTGGRGGFNRGPVRADNEFRAVSIFSIFSISYNWISENKLP